MRVWAAGASARGDRLSLVLLVVTVGLALAAALLPGPVPVYGNVHDLFIPLNAAEAVRDGVRLHGDLHSPFGWVYFYLNYLADELLARWAPWASTPGVLLISGLLFFAPVLVVWALFRRALPGSAVLKPWLLPFLLALMVSPREADEFTHKSLLWYGMYNNHNWGLVLLQVAALAGVLSTGGRARLLPLILGMSLCLYLTAHYKVSFFFASVLVMSATAVLLRPSEGAALFSGAVALLAVLGALTWVGGYDYQGYLNDLLAAFDARIGEDGRHGGTVLVAALCAAATAVILAGNGTGVARAILVAVLAVAGVAIGVAGDWSRYGGYLLLAVCLVVLGTGARPGASVAALLAVAFLSLNLVLNVLSVGRTLQLKIQGEQKSGLEEATLVQRDGRRMHLLVPGPEGLTLTDLANVYAVRDDRVWVRIASYPATDRRAIPPYDNVYYMRAHREALAWVSARLPEDAVVGEVEFSNAFPVLTDTGSPRGLHWLHIDNTLSDAHLPEALDHILDWDVVLVPVMTADGTAQVVLNCAAFDLLARHAPDIGLARVTEHYIYLVRMNKVGIEASRERWRELDRRIVQPACEALAENDQG